MTEPKHTLLLIGSTPDDVDQLMLDNERREIELRLRSTSARDAFDVRVSGQFSAKDLAGEIMRFNPSLLHFSGHGNDSGELLFRHPNGNSQPAKIPAVAEVFKLLRGQIRCIVLNACYSADQANRIAEHIDIVIGMRKELHDESAIAFSAGFYEALGYRRSFADAFELGKSAIDMSSLPDSDMPVLHARIGIDPSTLYLFPTDSPNLARKRGRLMLGMFAGTTVACMITIAVTYRPATMSLKMRTDNQCEICWAPLGEFHACGIEHANIIHQNNESDAEGCIRLRIDANVISSDPAKIQCSGHTRYEAILPAKCADGSVMFNRVEMEE